MTNSQLVSFIIKNIYLGTPDLQYTHTQRATHSFADYFFGLGNINYADDQGVSTADYPPTLLTKLNLIAKHIINKICITWHHDWPAMTEKQRRWFWLVLCCYGDMILDGTRRTLYWVGVDNLSCWQHQTANYHDSPTACIFLYTTPSTSAYVSMFFIID